MQNLLNESTTQKTTNDKKLPKNFNLFVFIVKELQGKLIKKQSNDLDRERAKKFLERETLRINL